MARPRHENPTPGELGVLQAIWERGPSTVREVLTVLNRKRHQRAYTTVMSLMNVMVQKGLLHQKLEGRAYIYSAKVSRDATQSHLVRELLNRVFDGSAGALVVHLLQETKVEKGELEEIRRTIAEYVRKKREE